MNVGIVGGSGFTGMELLRLATLQPAWSVRVVTAQQHAGQAVADRVPSLAAAYPTLRFEALDPGGLDGLDLVFFCLPHGQSQEVVPSLVGRVGLVVDLAADFRLKDPAVYEAWYGGPHRAPELLGRFVYGLPELHRAELAGATLVAAPGCYPTAAALALRPFVDAGVVVPEDCLVDAASGVSGAGSGGGEATQFATVDGTFSAYGLPRHRHTPEIEQESGARVLFVPHLAPMTRGILATCYARLGPERTLDTAGALALLAERYRGEPFVVVDERLPTTKATLGSNAVHLSARVDERTGWLVVLAAIDNLVRGASGQAVQAANVALGAPETTGLSGVGVYP
ncbi:N-acetyl-gamma-glutamyl-phosphate reductase [Aciditerrimonas ferrireducens]|jgi:N-acetyl-gamma-glutamyl-phosphate reductase|uniref:N-acetyl-gamma-glutamyl-phosphate reductase n=1 Tax=Aciditerrimonas ferrireducens TaxID=667306 RepID=A0ABV6C3H4_9ACTN|nr:N-acetyl-gamma-glutamyl-phosphate reductase [Aciditerrimonas ferrireducens]MCK4177348.1 N-acetyl-gamma-glutamyl-phosphate reductase [Aciditerrimonas ferrireducens]